MKKILILIIVLFASCAVQKKTRDITPVNVGTVANDGTGDPLRTAMQKLNANDVIHSDSIYYLYNEIKDTISHSSFAPTWLDTTYTYGGILTYNQGLSLLGGGGGGTSKFFTLTGIVDETEGIPEDGDSLIIHTNFAGKTVNLWRDGILQVRHTDNTKYDGFRFNSGTGTITTRPVLSADEEIVVWSTNTILWEALIPEGGEGGGGEPPETPLLEDLIAYYDCDETSGSILNDSHGSNDATIYNSSLGAAGILGNSVAITLFEAQGSVTIPYNAALVPTDSIAISLWFNASELPSTLGHPCYLYRQSNGSAPYTTTEIQLYESGGDNYIYAGFVDADGDGFSVGYGTPLVVDTWYHVVAVNRGDGNYCEFWVNGVRVDETASFDGAMYPATGNVCIGNYANGGEEGFKGRIDEVAIYNGLSPAKIISLYNSGIGKTYPFE